MGEVDQYLLIGGTIILGLFATVVYYIARYSFRSHDEDPEVLPSLKKTEEVLTEKQITKPKTSESTKKEEPLAPQKDLKKVLANTKANIFGRLKDSLLGKSTLSDDDMEYLEEVLYTSDMGPKTVERLMAAVETKLGSSEKKELTKVQSAIKEEINLIFSDISSNDEIGSIENSLSLIKKNESPKVWMIVGVNGAGKTTSIGKMANLAAQKGLKVLVAAGDTFRAAAGEQLKAWTERAQVEIFFPEKVTDPSAVAFDACQKGVAGNFDLIIIDTAGRLHTQENLMEELKKMKRVIKKVLPEAPNQTLIVLDASSGQNALMQAKNFNEVLGLSGAILTKLDGTAKGGVAIGLACELSLPIRAIGIGEGIGDIRPFQPNEFVDSII